MAETITFHELINNINIRDTVEMVSANEFINRFIPLHNPYAEFFPIRVHRTDVVKYNYVKRDGDAVSQKDYTIEGAKDQDDLDKVKVDGQTRFITTNWHDGVQYSVKELQTDHGLINDIEMVAPMTISKNISNKMLGQAKSILKEYSKKYEVEIDFKNLQDGDAKKLLIAILDMMDDMYQNNLIDDKFTKIVVRNKAKDLLLYLNDNKGLLGDNSVAQRMKFGDGKLSVECGGNYYPLEVWQDVYLPDDALVMPLHKKAMSLHFLGSTEGLATGSGTYTQSQALVSGIRAFWLDQATKSDRNFCVKASVYADFIPYTDEEDEKEKKSRWMGYVSLKAPAKPVENNG